MIFEVIPKKVDAEEQIELIVDAIKYPIKWKVIGRSTNRLNKFDDKSHPFVNLFSHTDEYFLIMFHDETGYYNIEESFPDTAIEIFYYYTEKLKCEIELNIKEE